MPYSLAIEDKLLDTLKKLYKKDRLAHDRIRRKMGEIIENPHSFKPLGNIMKGERRVHIGHFVLTFTIMEKEKVVRFLDYDHHDNIYNPR